MGGIMGYSTFTCPVEKDCGGCEWLAVPYPIQLKRKTQDMQHLFEPLTSKYGCSILPIIGMENPQSYRYKAVTPLAPGKNRSVQCGFFKRGTHTIVRCSKCLVEAPDAREFLNKVTFIAEKLRISAYNEDTHEGYLRHLVLRIAYATQDIMLTVVTSSEEFPRVDEFIERVMKIEIRGRHITTLAQNINPRITNAILGSKTKILAGKPTLTDKLLGCTFELSPTSFYQTNPIQTEKLYQQAIKQAELAPGDIVMDAYCGCGTIGLCAAQLARRQGFSIKLIGVERVECAIENARRNSQLNDLENHARFIARDATIFMQHEALEGNPIDILFMDPPRAGATYDFIQAVSNIKPRRIVYISCNPVTQMRDLTLFGSLGYKPISITPIDMFPHTKHVETIACLDHCCEFDSDKTRIMTRKQFFF